MSADQNLPQLALRSQWSVEAMIGAIDVAFLSTRYDEVTLKASSTIIDRLLAQRRYDLTEMRLNRASWNRSTPFLLSVGSLKIRPVRDNEMIAFCALLSDEDIARMLVNLPHPIDDKTAQRWIDKRQFKGRAGFQLGVFQEGTLVGSIGISALSNALVYFLAPEARGKGFAKQMIAPFVAYVSRRWALERIFAGVFCDNPASRHILEEAGFAVIGEGMVKSPARSQEEAFWEMELLPSPPDTADIASAFILPCEKEGTSC